jgi:hypothetical protein
MVNCAAFAPKPLSETVAEIGSFGVLFIHALPEGFVTLGASSSAISTDAVPM